MPQAPKGKLLWTIEVRGFKEAQAKLKTDVLFAGPVTTAFQDIGRIGATGVRASAPHGPSGQTAAQAAYKVARTTSAKPIPSWVVIKTGATRASPAYPRGYPYPRIQNYSPYAFPGRRLKARGRKSKRRVIQNYSPPRGTNRNRHWFDRAINRAEQAMTREFEAALDRVERIWAS